MNIYMIGIGGIGMSALAQLYLSEGHEVTGSDREESPTTQLLKARGARIIIGQNETNVPEKVDLVVFSDAIYPDNPEYVVAEKRELPMRSYFEALGYISKDKKTIAVAGTHGKTTTTAFLVKVLKEGGINPTAIIGSLVPQFGSNFISGGDLFVVEACEYKDHLLKLSPEILVITNLEWDHTDWFKTFEDMQETFKKAIDAVPETGVIVTNPNDKNITPLLGGVKARVVDYTKESVPELELIGEFNAMNARAAKAAAKCVADVPETDIDIALAGFTGTWRRFEKKGETTNGALVFDDYAHHPTAIQQTLRAVKEHFPEKHIVVAFHPHLYSRTHDLMDEFAESFTDADKVIIAPIYAAREEPIPGVAAQALTEKIGDKAQSAESLDQVLELLKSFDEKNTVLITMGAGDIYKIAEKLV